MNRYLWGLGQFLCSLAGPVSPFPDGFFYAVRNQLGGVTGWAQLIRIETNGTVEEIAPLWGDDGIPKLTGGYTLAWHSFYRRLFAYVDGLPYGADAAWASINPINGHTEVSIEWTQPRPSGWADLTVRPGDPLLYALYYSGDIIALDPRDSLPPAVDLHCCGCGTDGNAPYATALAYVERKADPQAGFYVRYADCPNGAFQLLTDPSGEAHWVGAPLPPIRGLFWDPGTARLFEWTQPVVIPPNAPEPIAFWILHPITGERSFGFQWDLGFEVLGMDFVPSTQRETIDCLDADITADGTIDLKDYASLQACFGSPWPFAVLDTSKPQTSRLNASMP